MKNSTYIILILVLVGMVFFVTKKSKNTENSIFTNEYVTYKNSEYSPEFTYPKSWGEVTIKEGNKVCPEEDTYRTGDTLNVFDWEFSFPEIKLNNSDSFIRTGVRIYELDSNNPNTCGGDFLLKMAEREVIPESISSFKLSSITNQNGLSGIYNQQASRLNTEYRTQYTFFINRISGIIYVVQPYTSFVPYFDSRELKEMEEKYNGDMLVYLMEGDTSQNIRMHLEEFKKMVESLKFSGE